MAIPDGKPATDFSAMNREWVRAVAEEAGGGIPAPENPSDGDVLTYSSTDSAWVAAAPGGGGGDAVLFAQLIYDEHNIGSLNKTWAELKAAFDAHKIIYITSEYMGDATSSSGDIYIPSSIYEEHAENADMYAIAIGEVSFETDSVNGYPCFDFS